MFLSLVASQCTVYFRSEVSEIEVLAVRSSLDEANIAYSKVALLTPTAVLVNAATVDPAQVSRKKPERVIERLNLIDIYQQSLELPGVVAAHIPGLLKMSAKASREETTKYTKMHDIRQPIPHDIIRDQRRTESEL